jgi:hypothetical protein
MFETNPYDNNADNPILASRSRVDMPSSSGGPPSLLNAALSLSGGEGADVDAGAGATTGGIEGTNDSRTTSSSTPPVPSPSSLRAAMALARPPFRASSIATYERGRLRRRCIPLVNDVKIDVDGGWRIEIPVCGGAKPTAYRGAAMAATNTAAARVRARVVVIIIISVQTSLSTKSYLFFYHTYHWT